MSWLTNLFKKKEPDLKYKFYFVKVLDKEAREEIIKDPDHILKEDYSKIFREYVLAKEICPHLKVKGTKYYKANSVANGCDIRLYLRCRYFNEGKRTTRESVEDLLKNLGFITQSSYDSSHPNIMCHTYIDLKILLKNCIDYVLVDKDEDSGAINYYYSFKFNDSNNTPTEGYLFVQGTSKEINDALMGLI